MEIWLDIKCCFSQDVLHVAIHYVWYLECASCWGIWTRPSTFIRNFIEGNFWKVNCVQLDACSQQAVKELGSECACTNFTSQLGVIFCVRIIRVVYMIVMIWNSETVGLSVTFLSIASIAKVIHWKLISFYKSENFHSDCTFQTLLVHHVLWNYVSAIIFSSL